MNLSSMHKYQPVVIIRVWKEMKKKLHASGRGGGGSSPLRNQKDRSIQPPSKKNNNLPELFVYFGFQK